MSHSVDNEGFDDVAQIPLGSHSFQPKDVHVSASTCPDTISDHQSAFSVSVMLYKSTANNPPECPQTRQRPSLKSKQKSRFVTEDIWRDCFCIAPAMLSYQIQTSLALMIAENNPKCGHS